MRMIGLYVARAWEKAALTPAPGLLDGWVVRPQRTLLETIGDEREMPHQGSKTLTREIMLEAMLRKFILNPLLTWSEPPSGCLRQQPERWDNKTRLLTWNVGRTIIEKTEASYADELCSRLALAWTLLKEGPCSSYLRPSPFT